MDQRVLGQTGINLSMIGFGAFKIGRNQGIKYPKDYELPDDKSVDNVLNSLLDLGINYIDTAPAYGLSEERIGNAIGHRRNEFVLSTKVGEVFENGKSTYDFSKKAIHDSISRSRERLRAEILDLVFIHSDGNDLQILKNTDAAETLLAHRDAGDIAAIGFSGKSVEGAQAALQWADAIMVEYHMDDRSHEPIIAESGEKGVGVIVKKGLASGRLGASDAIQFVLKNKNVTSMVIGSLNLDHIRENIRALENV